MANPEEITQRLQDVKNLKEEGSSQFKNNNIEGALEYYLKSLDLITEIKSSNDKLSTEHPELFSSINKEAVLLFSNQAICFYKSNQFEKAIDSSNMAIQLDRCHDKSYIRLILSYTKMGKLEKAVMHYKLFMSVFNKETINKNSSMLKSIEENEEFKVKLEEIEEGTRRAAEQYSKSQKKGNNLYVYMIAFLIMGMAWYYYNSQKPEEPIF